MDCLSFWDLKDSDTLLSFLKALTQILVEVLKALDGEKLDFLSSASLALLIRCLGKIGTPLQGLDCPEGAVSWVSMSVIDYWIFCFAFALHLFFGYTVVTVNIDFKSIP